MAETIPVPVRLHEPRIPVSQNDFVHPVPVVVLDEAMLASGFLMLRSAVSLLLRSGAPALIVDISAVERLSSSTVSALLWAQRRCRVGGGSVVLRGASRRTVKTLRRTGLRHVFELENEPARSVGELRDGVR